MSVSDRERALAFNRFEFSFKVYHITNCGNFNRYLIFLSLGFLIKGTSVPGMTTKVSNSQGEAQVGSGALMVKA